MATRRPIFVAITCVAVLPHLAAEESAYIGSAACGRCHEELFQQQAQTGHAGSLAPPESHVLAKQFQPLLKQQSLAPHWAFGGGIQAVTFVSRTAPEQYLEHRATFYKSTGRLGVTPGHDDARDPGVYYPVFSATGAILRCFLCHSTGTPRIEDGGIVPEEPGVRCETCHGPGRAHAAKPTLDNIARPSQYSAQQMNQACGSCHRKPAAKGDDTDFQNSWNARHQPLYLAQSKCFIRSDGKLKCTTCHPPHGGPVRAVCAECHAGTKHPATVRLESGNCEGCHMPVVRPKVELGFANHWIGVYLPGAPLRPVNQRSAARDRSTSPAPSRSPKRR